MFGCQACKVLFITWDPEYGLYSPHVVAEGTGLSVLLYKNAG